MASSSCCFLHVFYITGNQYQTAPKCDVAWSYVDISPKRKGWWKWPPMKISPSSRVPERGLDWFLEDCGGGTSDLGLPQGFLEYLGIYSAKRGCGRPPRWAQPTRVRLGLQAPPGVLCSPRAPSSVLLWPTGCLLAQTNSSRSFIAFGLRLILISCDVKNMQKTMSGTWLCQ